MKRSVADSVAKAMFENLHKPEITKFYKQASDEKVVDLSKSQPDQLVELMLQASEALENKGFVVASVLVTKAASCLTHNDVKDCADAKDCVEDSNDVTMQELLNTPSLSSEHTDFSGKETKSLEEELDELERDPAYGEISEILNDPELKDLFTQIRNKKVNERRLDSLLETLPDSEPTPDVSEEEQDELLKEIKEANAQLDLFLKQAESEESMSEFDQELVDWLKGQGVEVEVHKNKGLDEELNLPGGFLGKDFDLGDDSDGSLFDDEELEGEPDSEDLSFDEAFEDEDLSEREILELLKNNEY